MYSQFGLFIDGRWTPGTVSGEVISPVTEKPLGRVALATAEDTQAVLDAAARALPKLREMGGFARADALHKATGKYVDVRVIIDDSVKGGLVARVGDTVIDGSVRRRLELLRNTL